MNARSIDSGSCDTVVIGAGPYGLAVAAHLRARGVATRIFGEPMAFWRRNMPKGMKLRSPWGATSIPDPECALSLNAYIEAQGLPRVEPLPIETFIDYGAWFQAKAAPDVERRRVSRVETADGGFRLFTEDGETLLTKRAVIAMGLAHQQFRPEAFANAPATLVTHTSEHDDFAQFRGKRVAVVGRGQSACETAALLSEIGAAPELISRGPIRWFGAGKHSASLKGIAQAALSPVLTAPSAVGRFPLNWLAEAPGLVHLFSQELREAVNTMSLRAGAAGWLLPRFDAVRVLAGVEVGGWATQGDKIELKFAHGAGAYDHVVLATGYKIDIAKLGVFAPDLLASIECREGAPKLSVGLESSARGLHFVGASAVSSFGPLLRFIAGAGFAARQVARAIASARKLSRSGRVNRLEYDLAR